MAKDGLKLLALTTTDSTKREALSLKAKDSKYAQVLILLWEMRGKLDFEIEFLALEIYITDRFVTGKQA